MDDAFRSERPRRPTDWVVFVAFLTASLAPIGCRSYMGSTAASFLRRVREDPDPNARYVAYAKLADPGCYDTPAQKSEAVQTLVTKLKKGLEPVATRAVICHTLGELRDGEARAVIVKAVNDPDGVVRVEACRALGKVGLPEDATVLARVMTVDTLEDCRIAAVESLAELKANDPRITGMLLDGMSHDDPALRYASLNALRKLTGKDYGVDAALWVKNLTPGLPTEAVAAGGPAPGRKVGVPPRPLPPIVSAPPLDTQTKAAAYPPKPPPSNVVNDK